MFVNIEFEDKLWKMVDISKVYIKLSGYKDVIVRLYLNIFC